MSGRYHDLVRMGYDIAHRAQLVSPCDRRGVEDCAYTAESASASIDNVRNSSAGVVKPATADSTPSRWSERNPSDIAAEAMAVSPAPAIRAARTPRVMGNIS